MICYKSVQKENSYVEVICLSEKYKQKLYIHITGSLRFYLSLWNVLYEVL